MQSAAQQNSLQAYQIALYNKALHPELFTLRGRRVFGQSPYVLESWALAGGHVLRLEFGSSCFCELVTDREAIPTHGVVAAMPCGAERDYEHQFEKERVNYLTTIQSEQLGENLYLATYDEMNDYAQEVEAVTHRWHDESGKNMSIIDVQQFSREVHIQTYHLHARGGVVLRTQTIFECR
ncbi:MAG: hypothetical protein CMJ31_09595 [Phycisphaerae bacterium]|nr:hypothetical protein [Phycisphaerae bacterium]|tara:strand:+ start:708 stop:1247 length:540 start_codon:yes stop_codon:yes gene_type:complete